jgi:predicted transcriptional regulator/transcriptional regulator with XRE-family HTH domain
MSAHVALGAKIRTLRRQHRLTQTELARRLGVSPSYINLIEHNRRPFRADLLLKLAEVLPVDLRTFAPANEGSTVSELLEVFGDPMFENLDVITPDVNELATAYPAAASAIVRLYAAFRAARQSTQDMAEALSKGVTLEGVHQWRFSSEEVSDVIQQHQNYFPQLELGAEQLVRDAKLEPDTVFPALVSYLERVLGVRVRIDPSGHMQSAVRNYDRPHGILSLSEDLPRSRRNFQLAAQVGLLVQHDVIGHLASNPLLTTNESRASCRVALSNYFAAAVLMPYDAFRDAARRARYDIERLSHRFDASFEQICHRLATLQRPGAEGIPLHMLRVDISGNMSKHFTLSGLRIPRFGGACPLWNIFGAFLTPGVIRTQLSQMPDGKTFFGVARTVRGEDRGFSASRPQYAVGIGCDVAFAKEMVYADGLNLTTLDGVVPVGPSCRLCERMDCEQRAYPPLHHPFPVDENRRGISFYAPPPPVK